MSSPPGALPFYEFPEHCISGMRGWAQARAERSGSNLDQARAACEQRAGSGQEEEGTTRVGF